MIAPVLGLLAAAVLLIDPAFAQGSASGLIDAGDNPSSVGGATQGEDSLREMILRFVNFFLFFLGLVATAFVIMGGFLYVTSRGDDQAVEKAKKILIFAAIGILIVLVSFALINTLLSAGLNEDASRGFTYLNSFTA